MVIYILLYLSLLKDKICLKDGDSQHLKLIIYTQM